MSLKHLLLPLAALAGSAAFLTWQHFAQDPVRQEAALFRDTIQTVSNHRAAVQAKAGTVDGGGDKPVAGPAGKASRAMLDLKEMARLMGSMSNGMMPDMKAMLQLQKAMLELEPEEIAGLITEAGTLEIPAEQRDALVMMLIQGLGERDPKAAVLAAAGFMKSSPRSQFTPVTYTMQHAFASWAKKDPAGALAWFDGAVAEGQFESTALSGVNQEQTQLISGILKPLWEKDPAAARQRLLAMSEAERSAILSGADGFEKDEASQQQFGVLVRGMLPEKEQVVVFKQLAERVYGQHSLEGVTKLLSTIEATPAERKALVAEVAETSIRQRTWANSKEKPTLENTTQLRTWLAQEDAAGAESTLGKSLGSSAQGYGSYSSSDAIDLVSALHTAQSSDDLLVSFLEQASQGSNLEAYQTLAGKITDPAVRAATLEKLAKR